MNKKFILVQAIIALIILLVAWFIFTNGTSIDFDETIAKNDEVTNKRTLALVATSDNEGLKRAGVSDEELVEITELINRGDLESFKKLEEFGATAEEMQLILDFLVDSGRISEDAINQITDNVHAEVLKTVKKDLDKSADAFDAAIAANANNG